MSDSNEEDPAKLCVHEWTAIAVLCGLLLLFTGITFFSGESGLSDRIGPPHHIVDPEIAVFIEGEVEHPGHYRIKRGSTIHDLILLAIPSPDADLSHIKLENKLRKSHVVKIPSKYVTVYLEGAVIVPGPVKLLKGARLQDLISMVQFQEGADIEKLRRKRRLKDKEVITVSAER